MLFLYKRNHPDQRRSGKDACLSIVGLFLAIGIVAGLAALIYGLVKNVMPVIIASASVLGVSVLLTLLFVLLIATCHK